MQHLFHGSVARISPIARCGACTWESAAIFGRPRLGAPGIDWTLGPARAWPEIA